MNCSYNAAFGKTLVRYAVNPQARLDRRGSIVNGSLTMVCDIIVVPVISDGISPMYYGLSMHRSCAVFMHDVPFVRQRLNRTDFVHQIRELAHQAIS